MAPEEESITLTPDDPYLGEDFLNDSKIADSSDLYEKVKDTDGDGNEKEYDISNFFPDLEDAYLSITENPAYDFRLGVDHDEDSLARQPITAQQKFPVWQMAIPLR